MRHPGSPERNAKLLTMEGAEKHRKCGRSQVLVSELDLARVASTKDGRPIASKRKQRRQHPFAQSFAARPDKPVVPSPATRLHWTASARLVLLTQDQAIPYTRLSRPVSCRALGLIVLAPEIEGTTIQCQAIKFMAQVSPSGEPVLLSRTLYQAGPPSIARKPPPRWKLSLLVSCDSLLSVMNFRWLGRNSSKHR